MKKAVSLENLDLTKQCEDEYEFEYVDPAGNRTGVFISVVGGQSERVRKFNAQEVNRMRRQEMLAKKKGKKEDFTPIEDDLEYLVCDAAIRITKWRGIDQECTPENSKKLCRINAVIRQQVIEHSNDLANFTKSK